MAASKMNFSGLIDIHSHLLPGIDDGCVRIEDSLKCIESLAQNGFAGTICTPHVCDPEYPGNSLDTIAQNVAELQQSIDAAGLNYHLWPGAEVRIAENTIEWFYRNGVPTLSDSRFVLVDYWGQRWQTYCEDTITYLLNHEFIPVLAHPERMKMDDISLHQLMSRLERSGVCFQGNLRCIAGGEGLVPTRRMRGWLEEGRYRFIATDMHRPNCLAERLAGIPIVNELIGAEDLLKMFRRCGELIAIHHV